MIKDLKQLVNLINQHQDTRVSSTAIVLGGLIEQYEKINDHSWLDIIAETVSKLLKFTRETASNNTNQFYMWSNSIEKDRELIDIIVRIQQQIDMRKSQSLSANFEMKDHQGKRPLENNVDDNDKRSRFR